MRHTKGPARFRLSWIVSICSAAARRPDHTFTTLLLYSWIKEGRTGAEERFAFTTGVPQLN
jgi:hypothetical protein